MNIRAEEELGKTHSMHEGQGDQGADTEHQDSEDGHEEETKLSWGELHDALEETWKIAQGLTEDEATGSKAAAKLGQRLRMKSQALFDVLEGTLELAGLDHTRVREAMEDLVSLARNHQKEFFVHGLTDSSAASGELLKIHNQFKKGLGSKAELEEHRKAA